MEMHSKKYSMKMLYAQSCDQIKNDDDHGPKFKNPPASKACIGFMTFLTLVSKNKSFEKTETGAAMYLFSVFMYPEV